MPATRSANLRAGAPSRRPSTAMPPLSSANQVMDPIPTPARSVTTWESERATPAAAAAAKIAAQVAMVRGFDAVASNDVRSAPSGGRAGASSPGFGRRLAA